MSAYGYQSSYQVPGAYSGAITPDFWQTGDAQAWQRQGPNQSIDQGGGTASFWSTLPTSPLGNAIAENYGVRDNKNYYNLVDFQGTNDPNQALSGLFGNKLRDQMTPKFFANHIKNANDDVIRAIDQDYGKFKDVFRSANQYYVDAAAAGEPMQGSRQENQRWLRDAWDEYSKRINALGLA